MSVTLERPDLTERRISQWPGFWAMVRKELRENFILGVIGLIGISIGLIAEVTSVLSEHQQYAAMALDKYSQIWSGVNMAFFLSAPVVGFLIGASQIFREQTNDIKAFLIHRPTQRKTIFWAKITAGLCVYFASALFPLLAFVLWSRIPGDMPGPFDPYIVVRPLYGIFSGVLLYLATLLFPLGSIKRLSGRAMIYPAAGVLVIGAAAYFGHMLLVILALAIIAFAFAAKEAFQADGDYEAQPILARLIFGALVFCGIVIMTTLYIQLLVLGWNNISSPAPAAPPSYLYPYSHQYVITQEGHVAIINSSQKGYLLHHDSERGDEKTFTTDEILQINRAYIDFSKPYSSLAERSRDIETVYGGQPHEQWFYLIHQRQLVCYSTVSRKLIGVLGPNGFRRDHPSLAGVFPAGIPMTDSATETESEMLVFSNEQFFLDIRKHVIKRLHLPIHDVVCVSGVSIPGLTMGHGSSSSDEFDGYIIVGQRKSILVSPNGYVSYRLSYPPLNHKYYSFQLGYLSGRHLFFLWFSGHNFTLSGLIDEISLQGKMVRQIMLPQLPSAQNNLFPNLFKPDDYEYSLVPATIVVIKLFHNDMMMFPSLKVWLPATAFIAILSAFLASLIARRCAYTRYGVWAWTFGALFLGLPGVLLMLALREWPAREVCHNCHKKRVVTREFCEHCGAPWAASALDGTEIFSEGA